VVVEESSTRDWQTEVSSWLVKSGCLYMMAWGEDCSSWHDSVDTANISEFHGEEIPEEKFVRTTWHTDEPLSEVFWFAKNCADHPVLEIKNTIILHISRCSREDDLTSKFESA
jgi:hypothetical protein